MMKTPTITIYEDTNFEWRWRLQAVNGRIIADSGEGYLEKRGAVRAAKSMIKAAFIAVFADKEACDAAAG